MAWNQLWVLAGILIAGCTSVRVRYESKNQYFPPKTSAVCILETGLPDTLQYEPIATIQASIKRNAARAAVGSVIAKKARQIGADAVLNLETELVFRSPLPWAVVGPRGQGLAIRLLADSPPLDCLAIGGTNL